MGASSEFFAGGYFGHAAAEPEMKHEPFDSVGNGNFAVDDLLDFPKEEEMMTDAFFDSITGNSGEAASSSALTVVDSCNSSVSGGEGQFNGDLSCRSFTDTQFSGGELCVPYDDLAELEWLSNFVEESFSTDDLHNLRLISPTTNSKPPTGDSSSATANNNSNNPSPIFPSDVAVPAKARSKRSRASPSKWASRLLLLSSPATSSSEANPENNLNPNLNPMNVSIKLKAPKATPCKKREAVETPGRKCLHCGSDKTPQWRTGPMGPKTLCNACGVRYKSGRLVPEYRPAASPTFISAKHSNSHRKVLELRRQKEMMRHHHHHQQQQQQQQHHQQQQHQMLTQASMFGLSNGQDDFLIHHHHPHQQNVGPDYRLMI